MDFDQIVVSTTFPFNVIRKAVIFIQPQQALIYPHLYRINRRLLNRLSNVEVAGRHQTDRRGGYEEFYGLREYRPGDSLKMIDWRRSAKAGEMVAREMTKPAPPRMMVLLDLSEPEPDHEAAAGLIRKSRRKRNSPAEESRLTAHQLREEQSISLAASLICDGYLHGYQVGLAVKGPPCPIYPPHHSLPHRARLFETLARLVPARRDLKPTLPAIEPSVIVTTGDTPQTASDANMAIVRLSGAKLQDYVLGSANDDLLSTRVLPASRREQIETEQAMRRPPSHPPAPVGGSGGGDQP